jgi:hypothetical protein
MLAVLFAGTVGIFQSQPANAVSNHVSSAACRDIRLATNISTVPHFTTPTACLEITQSGKRFWVLSGVWQFTGTSAKLPVLIGTFNPSRPHTGKLGGSTMLALTGTSGDWATVTPTGQVYANGSALPSKQPLAVSATFPAGSSAADSPSPTVRGQS